MQKFHFSCSQLSCKKAACVVMLPLVVQHLLLYSKRSPRVDKQHPLVFKTSRFSFLGHSSFSSFFVISVILRNLMSNSGASLQNNWKTSVDLVDYRLCLWQKNNLNSSDDSHITCTTHKELHSFGPESNNLILFSRVLQKHSLYAVLYNSLIWLLYSILYVIVSVLYRRNSMNTKLIEIPLYKQQDIDLWLS